jgi:hypothetical protein
MTVKDFKPGLLTSPNPEPLLMHAPMAEASTYVIPAYWDLRPGVLTANNQGQSSKCAAFAMAGMIEFRRWRKDGITQQIDPDPIYERAGELMGAPGSEGRTIESVLEAAFRLELITIADFDSARYLSTPDDARQALHRYGVVLAAFQITDKWFDAGRDGWIEPGGRKLGGHAVLYVANNFRSGERHYDAVQGSWSDMQASGGFSRMDTATFNEEFVSGVVLMP